MFNIDNSIKKIIGHKKPKKDLWSKNQLNNSDFYSKQEKGKFLDKRFLEMQRRYPNLNPDNPVQREQLLQLMERERELYKQKGIEEYWLEPEKLSGFKKHLVSDINMKLRGIL